ncbi:leukocyte receptor cluster member 1 [Impatiens glandulifera]|uniref:leukocyte receptor cluster member 1 n=1 Tax=Impatiens glandulifera TaxID=253017 RepID=UPI001FB07840|nr:leukocyte receptor cluster member 1 [Impatiens glandulifera]
MGGHGGLNILPQKRWNVYNFDNREKVKQDEEAAAKEEQLKREQSRKKDAEFRLEQLRTSRGLAPLIRSESNQTQQVENSHKAEPQPEAVVVPEPELEPQSNHINLFEGIKIFDPVDDSVSGGGEGKRKRRGEEEEKGGGLKKMKKKEEPPRTVGPEDEKYRLGYGIAGKGVKLPWYMSKPSVKDSDKGDDDKSRIVKEKSKNSGRKTLEELRDERLRREKKEKERERALIVEKKSSRRDDDRSGSNKRDFSRRKPYF